MSGNLRELSAAVTDAVRQAEMALYRDGLDQEEPPAKKSRTRKSAKPSSNSKK